MRIPWMRSRRSGRLLSAAILIPALFFVSPSARTEEPPVFALTNARLLPVSGPPIDKGTVVIRNGIIESVGPNVTIPSDARIIDATGLTVYPGLIDSLSDIGLEEPAQQTTAASRSAGPQTTPQGQQAAPAQSPDERQGLTPYKQAAEFVSPANRKIEAARSAGITTTLVALRRGYFCGQSSLVNLSGDSPGKMIVRTPVAFHITIAGRMGFGSGYPGSLMGAFAFVRQTLMDAQYYESAWTVYRAHPGAIRPEYSRVLEALQPLVHQNLPVVLHGNTPAEIQRVLDLAASFRLRLILSGAMEAGEIGTLLKEKEVPVLLSVKFPERERDADPDAKEELRDLRRRIEAPGTAAALAKAGVRFAFQSEDMANPADFLRNVRKTVDAGLDKEAAIRALTITPAEIFGVADRLGSIEKNKTANLIVTTGDLFDAKTRVKWVFVDGERYEPAEPEPSRGAGNSSGSERRSEREESNRATASGTWTLSVNTPQGSMDVSVVLRQSGNALSGSVTSSLGTVQIQEGSATGSSLTFKITVEVPGQGSLPVTFTGTTRGNNISGVADAGPMGKMGFTGSRAPGEL